MSFLFPTHTIRLSKIFLIIISFFLPMHGAKREVVAVSRVAYPLYRAARQSSDCSKIPVTPAAKQKIDNVCIGGKLYTNGITSIGDNLLAGCTKIIGKLSLVLNELEIKGKLLVHGDVCAKSFLTLSDARLKEEIVDLNGQDSLDALLALKPKEYDFSSDAQNILGCSGSRQRGFIAQEVKAVMPHAVSVIESKELGVSDLHQMDYEKLIPDLVGALQECHKKIAFLEERVSLLEKCIQ